MTKLRDVEAATPDLIDTKLLEQRFQIRRDDCISIMMHAEVSRYNALIATLLTQITHLQSCVDGETVLDQAAETVFHSILVDSTPLAWLKRSYPASESLPNFLSNLRERVRYVNEVLADPTSSFCRDGVLAVWLPGLYDQANFFTVLLQQEARSKHLPLHSLSLQFTVSGVGSEIQSFDPSSGQATKAEAASGVASSPEEDRHEMLRRLLIHLGVVKQLGTALSLGGAAKAGAGQCYVYGLFVESARWNIGKKRLEDIPPGRSSKLSSALPPIRIDVVTRGDSLPRPPPGGADDASAPTGQPSAQSSKPGIKPPEAGLTASVQGRSHPGLLKVSAGIPSQAQTLFAVEGADADLHDGSARYQTTPLYVTSRRDRGDAALLRSAFIAGIPMRVDARTTDAFWTKRALALFCHLDI